MGKVIPVRGDDISKPSWKSGKNQRRLNKCFIGGRIQLRDTVHFSVFVLKTLNTRQL